MLKMKLLSKSERMLLARMSYDVHPNSFAACSRSSLRSTLRQSKMTPGLCSVAGKVDGETVEDKIPLHRRACSDQRALWYMTVPHFRTLFLMLFFLLLPILVLCALRFLSHHLPPTLPPPLHLYTLLPAPPFFRATTRTGCSGSLLRHPPQAALCFSLRPQRRMRKASCSTKPWSTIRAQISLVEVLVCSSFLDCNNPALRKLEALNAERMTSHT